MIKKKKYMIPSVTSQWPCHDTFMKEILSFPQTGGGGTQDEEGEQDQAHGRGWDELDDNPGLWSGQSNGTLW